MTPLSSRHTATDVSTCCGGSRSMRRGDEPVHVPQHEEGEERDEDRQQKEVPHVLEEIAPARRGRGRGRIAGPSPRPRAGGAGRAGADSANSRTAASRPRSICRATAGRRSIRAAPSASMPGPSRKPATDQHSDDDGEQRAHRHASPDGQGVRPRDRRAQEIGECGREEHGQEQATGQPGEQPRGRPTRGAGPASRRAGRLPGPARSRAPDCAARRWRASERGCASPRRRSVRCRP